MTKTEFRQAAAKAGINPNIYGLIIDCTLTTRNGSKIYNGKVTGIESFKEWKTESEYKPMYGKSVETTFLSNMPYVTIRKDRKTYHVSVSQIQSYLAKLLNEAITAKLNDQNKNKQKS